MFPMLGVITTASVMMVFCLGLTVMASGQSVAPYSTCIKFTDFGYNIILQENKDCNSKQLSETLLYYHANGYNEVGQSNVEGSQTVHLKR